MEVNNKIVNSILAVAAMAMALLCVMSIVSPLRFDEERVKREKIVKARLQKIHDAETRYLKANGYYCESMDSLVAKGFLPDSLKYIPFSDHKVFTLTTSVKVLDSEKSQPVMECSAGYSDYLYGLDENKINNLTEEANTQGRFPGLKIGNEE